MPTRILSGERERGDTGAHVFVGTARENISERCKRNFRRIRYRIIKEEMKEKKIMWLYSEIPLNFYRDPEKLILI